VSDHPRDCPHGRQWGKCDTCDLATAHERIIGLVDENKQLQAERDYAALEYKREHALRLEIEAENVRLRAVAEAAKEGCDTCHKYNGADYCCDCYHAGSGTHDALSALDEEVGA
jgi:hypothetical protein